MLQECHICCFEFTIVLLFSFVVLLLIFNKFLFFYTERKTSQFHTENTQGNHVPSDQVNPPETGVLINNGDEGHPGYFLHVSEHDLKKLQRREDKREKKARKDEDKRSKRNHGNQKGM